MQQQGVYCITNETNGKRYIGSSVNIAKRFYQHKNTLNKGAHHSVVLQRAWDKYGEKNFRFHILDYCEDPEELLVTEQQYLESLSPEYNINPCAGSNRGIKYGPETRQKISQALKGRTVSLETRSKTAATLKGQPFTEERLTNIQKARQVRSEKITHCPRGHEYSPDNTYRDSNNARICRICSRYKKRERYRREHGVDPDKYRNSRHRKKDEY